MADICTTSDKGFTREAPLLDCPDGELRPADLLLSSFQSGAPTVIDVTVVYGRQQSERDTVRRYRWRTFLRCKEQAKHAKYNAQSKQTGCGFLAAAFVTLGAWGLKQDGWFTAW